MPIISFGSPVAVSASGVSQPLSRQMSRRPSNARVIPQAFTAPKQDPESSRVRPDSKMGLYIERASRNQERAELLLKRASREAYSLPPVKSFKDLGEHVELLLRAMGSFGLNFKHLFELATWNPPSRTQENLKVLLKRQSDEHISLLTTQGMSERSKLVESVFKKLK